MKSPKIFVILLNWNGIKDTLECLASLQKVNYPNFQPLIVDNGSTDNSVAVIRASYPHVPILETKTNLGFAGGNNVGIEWALAHHAEWILLLNNDTLVDPNILLEFLCAAKAQPKAKILGAKILRYHEPKILDHLGGFWNEKKGEFTSPEQGTLDHDYFNMRQVDYVCGAAFFMHRSVPKTIGLLEPRYFLFWEESDYCCRAKKAGIEIWTAPKAIVRHKISSSFTGGKPHTEYFWWRSRLLWVERNCSPEEKRNLYKKIIVPQIWKMVRHYLLRFLFTFGKQRKQKLKRNKAGCLGVIDYFRGYFGNCPASLQKKSDKIISKIGEKFY
jgi:GT2 family glycosyltransferase